MGVRCYKFHGEREIRIHGQRPMFYRRRLVTAAHKRLLCANPCRCQSIGVLTRQQGHFGHNQLLVHHCSINSSIPPATFYSMITAMTTANTKPYCLSVVHPVCYFFAIARLRDAPTTCIGGRGGGGCRVSEYETVMPRWCLSLRAHLCSSVFLYGSYSSLLHIYIRILHFVFTFLYNNAVYILILCGRAGREAGYICRVCPCTRQLVISWSRKSIPTSFVTAVCGFRYICLVLSLFSVEHRADNIKLCVFCHHHVIKCAVIFTWPGRPPDTKGSININTTR